MKKLSPQIPVLTISLLLSGCSFSPILSSSTPSEESHFSETPSSQSVSDDTPQEWIDMFTFENVTIKQTSYAMGTKVSWVYYVDGNKYIEGDEGTEQVESNGGEYYDWKPYYDQFVYDESTNIYTATDLVRTDPYADSWLNDVEIRFGYDKKMSRIEVDHHMASVHFTYVFEFSGWGNTSI